MEPNLKERTRNVNLDKMTLEEVDALSAQLGDKLREICDEACSEANRVCNVYGLTMKMSFVIEQEPSLEGKIEPEKGGS
jgi:hypothetical protein